MTIPAGITRKTKDNSNKNYRENAEWMQGKRIGRPKQVWVDSTINGLPLPLYMTVDEIEAAINEDTIKTYVAGHWEKVTLGVL
jgi:hypothetical protein